MPIILLLGAGFSRNWGAPLAADFFAQLIADDGVDANAELKERLWNNNNFEEVLAELQITDPAVDRWAQYHLNTLSLAINRVFARLNEVLFNAQFEFSKFADKQIGCFLTKFDAIFTLNQDLLIEKHYMDGNGMYLLDRARRFDGCFTPGLVRTGQQHGAASVTGWDYTTAMPLDVTVPARTQPYYKLHGSVNWHTHANPNFMVMGGGKADLIAKIPLLSSYYETFKATLNAHDTRTYLKFV